MYGCDCDGTVRKPLDRGDAQSESLRGYLKSIKDVTGFLPGTCPWNAMYQPIVREVTEVRWAMDGGPGASVLGPDPDYKLVQALGVYTRSLKAAEVEETKCRAADAEATRKAKEQARGHHG